LIQVGNDAFQYSHDARSVETKVFGFSQSAKKAFQQAGVNDLADARERYVRALDAFNRWLRQKENSAM
jgi:hypothetical protein